MEIKTLSELKELQRLLKQPTKEEFEREELIKDIYYAMGTNQKIFAIKAYRKMTGEGLKECKNWVEKEMSTREEVF